MSDWLRVYGGMIALPPTHGPQGPLAPPYADVYVSNRWRIRQDDDNLRLTVSAIVGNHGNIPTTRQVKVIVGMSLWTFAGAFRFSTERVYMIAPGLRPGEEVYTDPPLGMRLHYASEGLQYIFEARALSAMVDLDVTNNSAVWYPPFRAYLESESSATFTLSADDIMETPGEGTPTRRRDSTRTRRA